jgi:uncharacterized protein YbjQ (UPF0145 family)
MITTTTESIPGKTVKEILGVVKGSTIQSRHIGSDLGAGLKQIIGGELKGYSKMISKAREQAIERMTDEATALGADAIICMRMTTSSVMASAAEVLTYGTAVKLSELINLAN